MNGLIRWVQKYEQSGLTLVANKIVLGLVRHLLTIGGGFFINQGVMDNNDQETAIAAIVTLIGVAWSVLVKMSAKGFGGQAAVVALLICLVGVGSGCVSSTMEQVRKHDAKVISARVQALNGHPDVMVGIDWLALGDTGFRAALKEDPAGTIKSMGWDAIKTAAMGVGAYYTGKQVGLWGDDNKDEPAQPTIQVNGNSGTVNISGGDNSNTQNSGVE
jgi:hypothetical protein